MHDQAEEEERRISASEGLDELSHHVLRAQAGDPESLTWVVVYFSPLLQAQARYRLRGAAQNDCDPDDLVDETWAVTLPRLGDLRGDPRTLGRALLGFLTRTLLNKAQTLRDRQRRRPGTQGMRAGPGSSVLDQCSDKLGSASATFRSLEGQEALHAAIASLSAEDHEIVVLRGLEQRPNDEVAGLLGLTPAGASRRYQRALERLRRRLPGSLFDGLLG